MSCPGNNTRGRVAGERPSRRSFCEEIDMLLGWFEASDAKAFGTSLARFFAERVPAESPMNEKKFAAKTHDVLQKMSRQVQEFKATRKIGIYKKAQIGN